jgi:cytochrome c biogenesis protein ResB
MLGMINLGLSIFTRKLYRKEKFSVFLFHAAFIIILIGAATTRYFGIEGTMLIKEGNSSNNIRLSESKQLELPFTLHLVDFIIDYYPGSQNPSGYESLVVLEDPEKNIREERRIFMNNILKHRGYRFYQSSYTEDQKGTILSVSRDWLGTTISYTGYLILVIGIIHLN